jgi:hypothetical protein
MLSTKVTHPLEREYEGWLAREIEDHFAVLGHAIHVIVVSPRVEKKWPADLRFDFDGKLVGLQLKRPYLFNKHNKSFSQLYWKFDNPINQLEKVQNNSEIYYCLPTFINREYRRVSLHHCLFWRPQKSMKPKRGWYRNIPAKVKNKHPADNIINLHKRPRWGLFFERIHSCSLGKVLKKEKLGERMRELVRLHQELSSESEEALLLTAIPKDAVSA